MIIILPVIRNTYSYQFITIRRLVQYYPENTTINVIIIMLKGRGQFTIVKLVVDESYHYKY